MAHIQRHPSSVRPAPDEENGESELGRLHLEERCICTVSTVITPGYTAQNSNCPVHGAHPITDAEGQRLTAMEAVRFAARRYGYKDVHRWLVNMSAEDGQPLGCIHIEDPRRV